MAGDPVGPGVELGVGQPAAVPWIDGRRPPARGPPGPRSGDGGRPGGAEPEPRGRVPLSEELVALGGGQQGEVREAPLGRGGPGVEQGAEVPGQAGDRGAVEEVGVVLEGAGDAPRHLEEVDHEVELGRLGPRLEGGEGDPRQLQPLLRGGGQELEDHPQQRRPVGVARQAELVHQPLEGDVLVGEGAERGGAGAPEERREARVAREVPAQDQGVDEEADQPLDLAPRAVGDRQAHGEVDGAGLAVERGGEGGEEGHEEGGVAGAGQPGQGLGPGDAELPGDGAAAAGGGGGARPVGGELHGDEPRQLARASSRAAPPAPRRAASRRCQTA